MMWDTNLNFFHSIQSPKVEWKFLGSNTLVVVPIGVSVRFWHVQTKVSSILLSFALFSMSMLRILRDATIVSQTNYDADAILQKDSRLIYHRNLPLACYFYRDS